MNKYQLLADKAISEFKGGDVDAFLSKLAKENDLNKNEHQRLIEEFNIGSFLAKMQDGSHHEEYDVASPVVTHTSSASSSNSHDLGKAASHSKVFSVSEDMFHLDLYDDFTCHNELQKVASEDFDLYIFDAEDKWEDAEREREKLMELNRKGIEKLASDDEFYSNLSVLRKIASESDGIMKATVSSLSLSGQKEAAEYLLENSKFSTKEIINAQIEELPKEASEIIRAIARR